MRIFLLLAFCFFLFCVVSPPDLSLENEKTRIEAIPDDWKDEPVVILNDSVIITVSKLSDKNHIKYLNVSYILINKRNPTLLERMIFTEDMSFESTPVFEVTALYPDGKVWKSGPADFTSEPFFYSGKYQTNHRIYTFVFPRYVQGMIIRLSMYKEYTAPAHLSNEPMRYKYPILKKTVCLSYPKDYTINYRVMNGEKLPIDTVRAENATHKALWVKAKHLNKKQKKNRLKNPELWYAGLHFSIPPEGNRSYSWQEMGDHYIGTIDHAMQPSQRIKEMALRITHTNKDSIITSAFRLLQHNIRYFIDYETFHSFIPRPAAEIVDKGYGDCKDMATVLKVLLREKGIETDVALVTTEGKTQSLRAVPTLGHFNHAVLYHENSDGSFQIYDPTVDFGTSANSHYHIIGQKVLLLKKNGSRIDIIKMEPHYTNSITTSSRISKVKKTGKWQISGIIDLKGKVAYQLYPLLAEVEGEEKAAFLTAFIKEMFNMQTTKHTVKRFTSDCITLLFTANFHGNYLKMDKGGFSLDIPSLYGGDVRYTTLDYEGPRFFRGFTQHDTWELPKGFNELEKNDLEHWIAKGTWNGNGGIITRNFTCDEVNVPRTKGKEISDYYARKLTFTKATVWK